MVMAAPLLETKLLDVPIDPDEHFLHQVLGALTVTGRPEDEIQEAVLVPINELVERTRLATQVG
jgi:hypothetical protein